MKEKLKVLVVCGPGALGVGGVNGVLSSLVTNLSDTVDYTFLVYGKGKEEKKQFFTNFGINISHIIEPKFKSKLIQLAWFYAFRHKILLRRISEIMKNEGFQAVHIHLVNEAGIFAKAASIANIPVRIVHVHAVYSKPKTKNILLKLMINREVRWASKFATCKLACAEKAGESFFTDTNGVKVVLNPVNLDYYSSIKHAYSTEVRLLQIGRFDRVKNYLFSFNLLSKLIQNGLNVHLNVIGYNQDDAYYNEMMAYISDNSLESYISFYPSNYDKREAFSKSDFVLLPSLSEGLPLVAIESQAAGVLTLASDNVPIDVDFGQIRFIPLEESKWVDVICQNLEKSEVSADEKNAVLLKCDEAYYANMMYGYYRGL